MKKYLGIAAAEWDGLSWDLRRTYLEGMAEDEDLPFRLGGQAGEIPDGPAVRSVQAESDAIDLTAMREELEAARSKAA